MGPKRLVLTLAIRKKSCDTWFGCVLLRLKTKTRYTSFSTCIMQLINQIEHKIFDSTVPFAGPSRVPETASVNKGHLIMDNVTTISGQSSVGAAGDGSIELVTAFCEAAITGKPAPNLVEEAYYSSVFGFVGLAGD